MPSVCSALGAGLALYLSYRILDFAWLYARPSGLGRYLYRSAAGDQGQGQGQPAWALVTGATDGIGRALAAELAVAGFNVVLHGRSLAKLEKVTAELAAAHPARSFRPLVLDAFECHESGAGTDDEGGGGEEVDFDEVIARAVADLHLTVLVNCAGAGPRPSFGTLERYSRREVLDTVHLNAAFPALVSRAVIPLLSSSTSARAPSLIINVASVTDTGLPLVSFYGASKAFGHVLSLSLGREMAMDRRAVEVISHRVGATTATSHERRPPSLFWPAAPTVARAVLARTGCGRRSVVPYWPHALQQLMLALLPESAADRIVIDVMRERRTEQDRDRNRDRNRDRAAGAAAARRKEA
ncbi:hypothetical protein SLS62_011288 [Diatrype stigma]|uniref:Uncharacterized protein n=1 Tax=Diatrype stigma TaxID=117547 RepID=A0AAN9U728_9PEZI